MGAEMKIDDTNSRSEEGVSPWVKIMSSIFLLLRQAKAMEVLTASQLTTAAVTFMYMSPDASTCL